ncbi:MAG: SusF/SusE family outer membrane protein [Bacteroidales bacterium]|nr:SusF/SusE family outer membrane protein [Bacteroidales bacterium]
MKKNIEIIVCLFLLLVVTACSEDYMQLNKGETELAISTDISEVTLAISSPSAKALTLSWTSGTNKGTNCAINYVLQIDKAGNNFANCISQNIGRKIYKLECTNEYLNNLLLDTFDIAENATANIEARVIAIPADTSVSKQTSEAVTLIITTYKPVSKTLYIIGDATSGGWSLDNATKMNTVSGEAGGFVWTGDLSVGNYEFVTTQTGYLPSYNKDAGSTTDKLALRETNDDPDVRFSITQSGNYRIAVNLIDLTISAVISNGPKYSDIYFVGSFTSWGFVKMRQDPTNSFVFRYGAVLDWNGGGEFKFATADGSWDNMYHPTIAEAPFTHTTVTQDNTGDNKWVIPQASCGKAYKMALNITEGSEKLTMSVFEPWETLYMVGDATPGSWTITDATPMTKVDAYNFTWTGNLTAGAIKITCDKQTDWNGVWFMSATADETPTGTEQVMTLVDKINEPSQGSVDRKWKITEAGNYTITGNQLTETITFKKN